MNEEFRKALIDFLEDTKANPHAAHALVSFCLSAYNNAEWLDSSTRNALSSLMTRLNV